MYARDHQLVALIGPNVKIIALYSHKLTKTQKRYMVMEEELISIVETLKEFCTLLLGQELKIFTYHQNITCKTLIQIVYCGGALYYKSIARRFNIYWEIKTK